MEIIYFKKWHLFCNGACTWFCLVQVAAHLSLLTWGWSVRPSWGQVHQCRELCCVRSLSKSVCVYVCTYIFMRKTCCNNWVNEAAYFVDSLWACRVCNNPLGKVAFGESCSIDCKVMVAFSHPFLLLWVGNTLSSLCRDWGFKWSAYQKSVPS